MQIFRLCWLSSTYGTSLNSDNFLLLCGDFNLVSHLLAPVSSAPLREIGARRPETVDTKDKRDLDSLSF